jgi:uncharacterized membrane protein YgcG
MVRMPMARGKWTPKYTEMGGLTRQQESDASAFPTLVVSVDTAGSGCDRMSPSFLRIVPRVKKSSESSTGMGADTDTGTSGGDGDGSSGGSGSVQAPAPGTIA